MKRRLEQAQFFMVPNSTLEQQNGLSSVRNYWTWQTDALFCEKRCFYVLLPWMSAILCAQPAVAMGRKTNGRLMFSTYRG